MSHLVIYWNYAQTASQPYTTALRQSDHQAPRVADELAHLVHPKRHLILLSLPEGSKPTCSIRTTRRCVGSTHSRCEALAAGIAHAGEPDHDILIAIVHRRIIVISYKLWLDPRLGHTPAFILNFDKH